MPTYLASGMPFEDTRHIVHLVIDDEPGIVHFVVFLDLLQRELLFVVDRGFGCLLLDLLDLALLHPPIRSCARSDRMLETSVRFPICTGLQFGPDSVPSIVHHSGQVPGNMFGLGILEDVPCADDHLA